MSVRILTGDARQRLRDLDAESVHCCVTSPPYFGLRSYLPDGHADKAKELGLEATPDAYVAELVAVFRGVERVLRDDGVAFLNLGDSYAGSWGAQSRGGPPSASSTLMGNGHVGGGPKLKSLSAVQIAAHPHFTKTGSLERTPGLKPKDIIGIPWMVAFALRADGWYLRQDIIWAKPNPMPESVKDRCCKSHEYVFLLSKRERYWYDADAISEISLTNDGRRPYAPGQIDTRGDGHARGGGTLRTSSAERRLRRSVWTIPTEPSSLAHFAMMPTALAELCIKAGCPSGGTVLDPFAGAGTTGLVADRLGRNAVLIELNPTNAAMADQRLSGDAGMFASVQAERLEAAE